LAADGTAVATGRLEVEGIDLAYGAARVLRGVSLDAPLGPVTAVMGRNGVGKTSLLRAVMGQHPVAAGRIRWDGADITRLPPHARARRGVGLSPGRQFAGSDGKTLPLDDGAVTELINGQGAAIDTEFSGARNDIGIDWVGLDSDRQCGKGGQQRQQDQIFQEVVLA